MARIRLRYAPFANLDKEQDLVVCKFSKLSLIKGIVWWKVGLGKTRIALSLFTLLFQRRPKLPAICIFVARPSFLHDLKEEVRKIGLDAQISTKENQWFLSAVKPTILFISFANLQLILDEFHWIKRHLKFVIVDELYLYSNPSTQRSICMRAIASCQNVIGLSGSILPTRDNFALWGQLRAISLENKIANSATNFRTLYQTSYKSDFGHGECRLFQNKRGWEDSIFPKLSAHIDIRLPKVLNKTTEKITYVPLTSIQKDLIRSILENFYLEYNGIEQEYKYTFQNIAKIRGIVNGWIKAEGRVESVPCHKIETLFDQLAEISECNERCIVWCAFRTDVEMLSRLCKIANLQMVGGRPFDVATFRKRKHPIVFATLGSGASVNHFADVAYAKFFSLGYKPLDYVQAKGRNDRRSSNGKHVANYGHIHCRSSIDEVIYQHVQDTRATEANFIKKFFEWSLSITK